jgi:hypothetical protein
MAHLGALPHPVTLWRKTVCLRSTGYDSASHLHSYTPPPFVPSHPIVNLQRRGSLSDIPKESTDRCTVGPEADLKKVLACRPSADAFGVAVDAIGAHLLQTKRIAYFGEDRALDVPVTHIMAADKTYHVGVSDLNQIQLVRIGWGDEVLI